MSDAFQEFLAQLDSKKPIVLSLNLLSKEFLAMGTQQAEELRTKLVSMNNRFDIVCQQAARWHDKLQKALVESSHFYKVIQDLFVWLDEVEHQIHSYEPVDLTADTNTLHTKYNKLKVPNKVSLSLLQCIMSDVLYCNV